MSCHNYLLHGYFVIILQNSSENNDKICEVTDQKLIYMFQVDV